MVKTFKYLFFLFFLPVLVSAQENVGLSFGGQKEDIGYDVIQCSDGGFLLGGSTKSFGAGNLDIYLIKLNENGNTEWIKTFGREYDDLIRSVLEVNDGYIIVGDSWNNGYYRLDIYMAKIDHQGNIIWENLYETKSKNTGYDVLKLKDDNLMILGYSREVEPSGDILLMKTDSKGVVIWKKEFGTQYDDYGIELCEFDTNNILIVGTKAGFYDEVYSTYFNSHDADLMLICVDYNGNEIWQNTYGGEGHDFGYTITTIDNNIYICGSTQSEGNGSFDMLLLKTDFQGDKLWSKTFGGAEYDYGISMTVNPEGDLYLLGTTKSFGLNQSADFYLVKADTSGNELWSLSIGGDLIDVAYKLSSTADSGVILIGKTNSFGSGYYDVLVIKVDKNGVVENLISGIDSTYISNLQLYPNPVTDVGNFRTLSTVEFPELYIEIISLSGKTISSFRVVKPNYSFSTQNLSSGFYIYRVRKKKDSNIIFTGKLIVR